MHESKMGPFRLALLAHKKGLRCAATGQREAKQCMEGDKDKQYHKEKENMFPTEIVAFASYSHTLLLYAGYFQGR